MYVRLASQEQLSSIRMEMEVVSITSTIINKDGNGSSQYYITCSYSYYSSLYDPSLKLQYSTKLKSFLSVGFVYSIGFIKWVLNRFDLVS